MANARDDRTAADAHAEHPTVCRMRGVLLVLLVFGVLVTLGELLLLEHTEDYWQLTPLVILGSSLLVTLALVALPRPASVRAFQGTMVLFIVSGFTGLFLHYRGNTEFELEMYPSMAGFELFWEALKGATPTLAPAAMTFLGVVGLAFAYRYPGRRRI